MNGSSALSTAYCEASKNAKNCSTPSNFVSLSKNRTMGSLALNNKTLDKYFGFLRKLDNSSKKRLIIKLTESLEFSENRMFDLKSIYGLWEDSKDSDTIIKEIRDSRIDNREIEAF